MKMLLLFLVLATAAHADRWYVNGVAYNGTIHKLSADRTQVFVTSDWDNYGGSWLKVATLDPATRVKLNVATPDEQASVKVANDRARVEAEQRQRQQEKAQAQLAAERLARIEEQKLALQRESLELQRRQLAQQQQRPNVTNNTIIIPGYSGGYGGYNQGYNQGYSNGGYVPHVQVPRVPQVPQVPFVPQVPQVPVVRPIVLWYN